MKNWKLVSGIVSMCLFLVVSFQSCATNVANALGANDEDASAFAGMFLAFMLLLGGIFSVVTRKSMSNWGNILNVIIFGLGAFVGFAGRGSYADLVLWSMWALVCCFFAIVCYYKNKVAKHNESAKLSAKQWAVAVIVSFVIGLLGCMSSSSEPNEDVDVSTIEFLPCSVEELLEEEKANSNRAQQSYKGKYLDIYGYVDDVDNEAKYFTIDDGGQYSFSSIKCELKDENLRSKVVNLDKGDEIHVKGLCKEVGGFYKYVITVVDF